MSLADISGNDLARTRSRSFSARSTASFLSGFWSDITFVSGGFAATNSTDAVAIARAMPQIWKILIKLLNVIIQKRAPKPKSQCLFNLRHRPDFAKRMADINNNPEQKHDHQGQNYHHHLAVSDMGK